MLCFSSQPRSTRLTRAVCSSRVSASPSFWLLTRSRARISVRESAAPACAKVSMMRTPRRVALARARVPSAYEDRE